MSLDELGLLGFIDAGRLREDMEHLEALDYVGLLDGRVGLTEYGFTLMENRVFSFCPHL